jgi:hypothetical protein
MTSATTVDRSEFRHVLFSGAIVGAVTAGAVIVYLIVARFVPPGIIAALLETIVVLVAAVLATFLPGFFATSRTVQGVAGAAAIGLWGTIVFMAIDIILLRPFKAYPWTWDAVGGGSTWWYLPIWWMLGTLLAWWGGLVTAGRAARGGNTAITSLAIAPLGGGVGGALGLGLGGVTALPVGAGVGFLVTLAIFAIIVISRNKR